jgi:peptide deformylase
VPVRVCVVEVRAPNPRYPYKPPIPLTVLVNPMITPLSDETFDNFEGCLSVPDLRAVVPRHARIRVEYRDRNGETRVIEPSGISAGTYQHEVDHLDGKLFLDRVVDTSTLTTWRNFDRFQRERVTENARKITAQFGG